MKTTDSVMREFDELGVPTGDTEPDGQGGHTASYERLVNTLTKEQESVIKSFLSHSLSGARREVDERCERAEKLLDDVVTMFGKQNSDLHIIQEVRDLMALRIKEGKSVTATWRRELDLLTGDNPEEAKV